MKLVLVEWYDSFGCSAKWQTLDDVLGTKPLLCQSVGWVAHDGPDCKVIVPHVSRDHASVPRQGCGDMAIPAKAIVRITILHPGRKSTNA